MKSRSGTKPVEAGLTALPFAALLSRPKRQALRRCPRGRRSALGGRTRGPTPTNMCTGTCATWWAQTTPKCEASHKWRSVPAELLRSRDSPRSSVLTAGLDFRACLFLGQRGETEFKAQQEDGPVKVEQAPRPLRQVLRRCPKGLCSLALSGRPYGSALRGDALHLGGGFGAVAGPNRRALVPVPMHIGPRRTNSPKKVPLQDHTTVPRS